jgi:hypothetical protein
MPASPGRSLFGAHPFLFLVLSGDSNASQVRPSDADPPPYDRSMLIRHFQCTLLVAAVLVSTTAAAQSARESFSVAESRKAILDTLPHPKGTKFRQLFLLEHGDSKVTLCGEINAKDRAGVYLGFRRFMVDDLGESMRDPMDTAAGSWQQSIFDRVYQRACSDKFKDVK